MLSPGRKKQMIDQGIINDDGRIIDKSRFQKRLKYYQEFDRDNRVARQ
jgi:hypothetical protein